MADVQYNVTVLVSAYYQVKQNTNGSAAWIAALEMNYKKESIWELKQRDASLFE